MCINVTFFSLQHCMACTTLGREGTTFALLTNLFMCWLFLDLYPTALSYQVSHHVFQLLLVNITCYLTLGLWVFEQVRYVMLSSNHIGYTAYIPLSLYLTLQWQPRQWKRSQIQFIAWFYSGKVGQMVVNILSPDFLVKGKWDNQYKAIHTMADTSHMEQGHQGSQVPISATTSTIQYTLWLLYNDSLFRLYAWMVAADFGYKAIRLHINY